MSDSAGSPGVFVDLIRYHYPHYCVHLLYSYLIADNNLINTATVFIQS